MDFSRSRAWPFKRTVVTKTTILLDYNGIIEIDHAGQLMEWRSRKWDWKNDAPQKAGTAQIYIYFELNDTSTYY